MFALLPNLESKRTLYIVLLIVAAGLLWFAYTSYNGGVQKDLQGDAARKVAADTARSQNPFQTENPLSGVVTNPFEKVKKVLNPFEQ